MKVTVIATYDHLRRFSGGTDEVVLRGQEFPAEATGIPSSQEVARHLIRRGEAVMPDDWPKHKSRTDAKWVATQAEKQAAIARLADV